MNIIIENKKKKTNNKFAKRLVVFCILFIVLYTAIQTYLSYTLGIELSPTLTTSVYTFFGTELAACALIRVFDVFGHKKDEYMEDYMDDSNGIVG